MLATGRGASATDTAAKTGPGEAIPTAMRKFLDNHEIAGYVALTHKVGRPADIVASGFADSEQRVPMREDTLFAIASMTKPISAAALMLLVDEGKVTLDDPVSSYIPAFAEAKTANGDPVRGLTIRHLLTHTSGLDTDQFCHDSIEATANELAKRPFAFQPGEKWEYGPGITVAGRVVEIVSGQPFDQFVRERILNPLGMNNTKFHLDKKDEPRVAQVYKKASDGKSLVLAERWKDLGKPGSVPNPSGGLYSTASDIDRFYQMILGRGEIDGIRILSADAVNEMSTVQTGDLTTGFTPGNVWGLGWGIVRAPQGPTGMLSPGSFGHGGYYGTQGWIDPTKKLVLVLLIQRADIGNGDASEIRKVFQQAAVNCFDD